MLVMLSPILLYQNVTAWRRAQIDMSAVTSFLLRMGSFSAWRSALQGIIPGKIPFYYQNLRLACMDPNQTSLERAFYLARTGRCVSVTEIKLTLSSEGYGTSAIVGRVLNAQLRKLVNDSRPDA